MGKNRMNRKFSKTQPQNFNRFEGSSNIPNCFQFNDGPPVNLLYPDPRKIKTEKDLDYKNNSEYGTINKPPWQKNRENPSDWNTNSQDQSWDRRRNVDQENFANRMQGEQSRQMGRENPNSKNISQERDDHRMTSNGPSGPNWNDDPRGPPESQWSGSRGPNWEAVSKGPGPNWSDGSRGPGNVDDGNVRQSGSSWDDRPRGPSGSNQDDGPRGGPPGQNWDVGPRGSSRPNWSDDSRGTRGPNWDDGPRGPPGPYWDDGPREPPGSNWDDGPRGLPVPNREDGSRGPPGRNWDDGPRESSGPNWNDGSRGPGPDWDDGPRETRDGGPRGPGQNWDDGPRGPSGPNWNDGPRRPTQPEWDRGPTGPDFDDRSKGPPMPNWDDGPRFPDMNWNDGRMAPESSWNDTPGGSSGPYRNEENLRSEWENRFRGPAESDWRDGPNRDMPEGPCDRLRDSEIPRKLMEMEFVNMSREFEGGRVENRSRGGSAQRRGRNPASRRIRSPETNVWSRLESGDSWNDQRSKRLRMSERPVAFDRREEKLLALNEREQMEMSCQNSRPGPIQGNFQRPDQVAPTNDLRAKLARRERPPRMEESKTPKEVFICPRFFRQRFSDKDVEVIKTSLIKKLYDMAQSDGDIESKPQLRFCDVKLVSRRRIIVTCQDETTVKWLLDWYPLGLRVRIRIILPEDPLSMTVIGFITKGLGKLEPDAFKNGLRTQNPGLDVSVWRNGAVKSTKKGHAYTFLVDGHTVRFLIGNKWELFYEMQKLYIRRVQTNMPVAP